MMNVSVWNKKRGDWNRIGNVIKIERGKKCWFLYKDNGDCVVLEFSKYDLVGVDMY